MHHRYVVSWRERSRWDDSWIGPKASVRDGLTVGRNSLVGMGAVVIRDVPDNVVVAGIPAKVLRKNISATSRISAVRRSSDH